VDNPHNLEIDSFKIAVNEHILLYFKNSNRHDNVRHTLCMLCVISWCTHYILARFPEGNRLLYMSMDPCSSQNLQKYIQHELCADDQLKIKSTSHAVRNIIPSNNGLGVEKIVMFLVTG
jgi:hypothetical protein